jgi:hypothetical protein
VQIFLPGNQEGDGLKLISRHILGQNYVLSYKCLQVLELPRGDVARRMPPVCLAEWSAAFPLTDDVYRSTKITGPVSATPPPRDSFIFSRPPRKYTQNNSTTWMCAWEPHWVNGGRCGVKISQCPFPTLVNQRRLSSFVILSESWIILYN